MKEILKNRKKALPLLLVLTLMVQMIPTQAFANESEAALEEQEAAIESPIYEALEPTVVGEVEELREEDVKHFVNSDGSYTAVKYAEPVHFKETADGKWQDINNKLNLSSTKSPVYTPENSPVDVEFAQTFDKDKTVTLNGNEYTLSWTYVEPDIENKKSVVDVKAQ